MIDKIVISLVAVAVAIYASFVLWLVISNPDLGGPDKEPVMVGKVLICKEER